MLTVTPRVAPSIGGRLGKQTWLTVTPHVAPSIGGRLGKQTLHHTSPQEKEGREEDTEEGRGEGGMKRDREVEGGVDRVVESEERRQEGRRGVRRQEGRREVRRQEGRRES